MLRSWPCPAWLQAPEPALGRPAAAGGAGPGAGPRARGAAAGRAARGPRPQAPPADAGRAQGAPAQGRHHLHLRHHDQDEALACGPGGRVQSGRIEQIGTPEAIYDQPVKAFVAGFVGAANIIDAEAPRGSTAEQPSLRPAAESIRLELRATARSVRSGTGAGGALSWRHDPARGGAGARAEVSWRRRRDGAGGWRTGHRCGLPGGATRCGRSREHAGRPPIGSGSTAACSRPPAAAASARLGVVYLGSLGALLAQSFFVDESTGQVVREVSLGTYAELLADRQTRHHRAYRAHGGAVTAGSRRDRLPDRLLCRRYASPRGKALFYLAVMLPCGRAIWYGSIPGKLSWHRKAS